MAFRLAIRRLESSSGDCKMEPDHTPHGWEEKIKKEEGDEESTVERKSLTYIELGNSCNPTHRNICLLEGFTGIVFKK